VRPNALPVKLRCTLWSGGTRNGSGVRGAKATRRCRCHRVAHATVGREVEQKHADSVLHRRPLSPEDLETIRREIEAMDDIGAVDDEIRGIVARNWPDLVSKLPPEED
jgi:hypothetical protein